MAYGQKIHRSTYNPERSVIGEITKSHAGNLIIRVGQENGPADDTWRQTEHVVLVAGEAREFIDECERVLNESNEFTRESYIRGAIDALHAGNHDDALDHLDKALTGGDR